MGENVSNSIERRGHCLCGDVKITAKTAPNNVGACHCRMCRRWGGGPFMEIDCGSEVAIDGDASVSIFSSSDWAERGFCRNCGTHLFYRIKASGQHMIPIGLFEDSEDLVFDTQVFIDEKPGYYSFTNKTKNLTGAEIFELFGA